MEEHSKGFKDPLVHAHEVTPFLRIPPSTQLFNHYLRPHSPSSLSDPSQIQYDKSASELFVVGHDFDAEVSFGP